MVRWHHRLNRHEFAQTLGDSEGQGSLVCYSPWHCKLLDTKQQHTVLHCVSINLHSHQQYRKVLFSPCPQHCFVDFFDDDHSYQCEVIPHYSLICISLIVSDAKHLFMCLLLICMSFLAIKAYVFRSCVHFNWVLCFYDIELHLSCLYILEINPLLVASFIIIFSHY